MPSLSILFATGLQPLNHDVAEPDFIAMVLQANAAFRESTEALHVFELAFALIPLIVSKQQDRRRVRMRHALKRVLKRVVHKELGVQFLADLEHARFELCGLQGGMALLRLGVSLCLTFLAF